jgi:hypothetical protein
VPPRRIYQRGNSRNKWLVGKRIQRQFHFFCNSHMRICSLLEKIAARRNGKPSFGSRSQICADACFIAMSALSQKHQLLRCREMTRLWASGVTLDGGSSSIHGKFRALDETCVICREEDNGFGNLVGCGWTPSCLVSLSAN